MRSGPASSGCRATAGGSALRRPSHHQLQVRMRGQSKGDLLERQLAGAVLEFTQSPLDHRVPSTNGRTPDSGGSARPPAPARQARRCAPASARNSATRRARCSQSTTSSRASRKIAQQGLGIAQGRRTARKGSFQPAGSGAVQHIGGRADHAGAQRSARRRRRRAAAADRRSRPARTDRRVRRAPAATRRRCATRPRATPTLRGPVRSRCTGDADAAQLGHFLAPQAGVRRREPSGSPPSAA